MHKTDKLAIFDPEISQALENEKKRQQNSIELIASENFVSSRILEAYASTLTNKYAEGYPGKRYYGGCQYVDVVENIAIDRVKTLFGADYANVQPHSGSQANAAVYQALLQPGDTILGMSLNSGGHLTHGSQVNFSGKFYHAVHYSVDVETGLINYDQVAELANQYQPKMIIAGFSAYPRTVDWHKFREIADSIHAYLLVDMAHIAGLVATNCHPSPVQIADVTTSTTHKTLRGPRGGIILAKDNLEITKKLQSAIFPGSQGGPLMHVIAAKAVAFKEAMQASFKQYQQQIIVNAKQMADTLKIRKYNMVTDGTDTHLLLIDLREKNLSGKIAEELLGRANITVNKNSIPDDPRSPFVTSGLRIGSPAITTRGFKQAESQIVANWICDILDNPNNGPLINKIKHQVMELCQKFPIYHE